MPIKMLVQPEWVLKERNIETVGIRVAVFFIKCMQGCSCSSTRKSRKSFPVPKGSFMNSCYSYSHGWMFSLFSLPVDQNEHNAISASILWVGLFMLDTNLQSSPVFANLSPATDLVTDSLMLFRFKSDCDPPVWGCFTTWLTLEW